MVCMLNRKPYRDRNKKLRARTAEQCCGRKEKGGCTLSKQPEGQLISQRPRSLPKESRMKKEENLHAISSNNGLEDA